MPRSLPLLRGRTWIGFFQRRLHRTIFRFVKLPRIFVQPLDNRSNQIWNPAIRRKTNAQIIFIRPFIRTRCPAFLFRNHILRPRIDMHFGNAFLERLSPPQAPSKFHDVYGGNLRWPCIQLIQGFAANIQQVAHIYRRPKLGTLLSLLWFSFLRRARRNYRGVHKYGKSASCYLHGDPQGGDSTPPGSE